MPTLAMNKLRFVDKNKISKPRGLFISHDHTQVFGDERFPRILL